EVQLTWMDAKVGDWVVTPRRGKPVEVNALWANALRIAASLGKEFGDSAGAEKFHDMASRAEESFAAKFWNAEKNCLYDVLGPERPDASIRPNQVFAISLPFPLLDEEKRKAVMRVVEEKLLTPVGLRSLAPEDPKYKGRYEGSLDDRDAAYHQGTAWPWLLGPFVTAWLNAFGRTPENLDHCRKMIAPMEARMHVFGLGTINEIYDGDAPQYPHGCVAQAWSVAELLRVIQKELQGKI
ncbi:MAG TPA: amylo-alpha-1,6-glucosidase, partial [Bryobacteraceae bacterium]|nr:amylo-alpha-1,6-glucosidase [Bryobacteraceae bacterium]